MFNAIEPDSYIQPHHHGVETLFAIRGLMALVIFNRDGVVEQVQLFGVDPGSVNRNIAAGVEIPSEKYHTVVSLASGSILLEIKPGPFDPDTPKFLASWAPKEGTPESTKYLRQLMEIITCWLN